MKEKQLTMHEKWDLDSKSPNGGVNFTGEKRKSKEPVKVDESVKRYLQEKYGKDF